VKQGAEATEPGGADIAQRAQAKEQSRHQQGVGEFGVGRVV
jgi:hypothetical protein